TLMERAERGADPFDDAIVEYVDPETGRPVLPTMGCYLQMIRPGVETVSHRQTSTAIYHAVRGSGQTTIGDACYEWEAGDCFVVPPTAPHRHANRASEPAILFSLQD